MARRPFALLLLLALLAGCGPRQGRTLTIMTHDSFAVSESIAVAFEAENNVTLRFLVSGDTGEAVNKAVLAAGNPLADVFYGVDNTFLSRALEAEIFEPYDSPLLEQIPDAFELDPTHNALPVDYGDVCLNYDRAYFADRGLEPPGSLEDLLRPEYRGLLVVENPATSSPGLAFLLATIGHFGEEGYLEFWQGLRGNDVLVVNDWETAYRTEFSGSSGRGPRPIVGSQFRGRGHVVPALGSCVRGPDDPGGAARAGRTGDRSAGDGAERRGGSASVRRGGEPSDSASTL